MWSNVRPWLHAQEAQLPLSEQGVSFVLSRPITMLLTEIRFNEFCYTLRVGSLANLYGNVCMHASLAYENSTRSCLTSPF